MERIVNRRNNILSAIIVILLLAGFVGVVGANRTGSFDFSGTWTISYFQADCTTAWTQYAQDGTGFGGGGGISPVLNGGTDICVKVSVTGSTDNGNHVWYEALSITTTTTLPVMLFTIASGSGSGMVVL